MVCIYCSSSTKVINSRKSKKSISTWRRRTCLQCAATYTTTEKPDLNNSLLVKNNQGDLSPFLEEKLFQSIYESCKHRKSALNDSVSLKDTILRFILLDNNSAIIEKQYVFDKTHEVLSKFDNVSATYYKAYYSPL